MSIRNTLISTARVARVALPKAQVASRRAASGGAHKPSSNTPWAIGSAAVFGSLAAFILMPAGDKAAHDVHESIDAKGAGAHVADGASRPEHEDEAQANARELMRKERANGERPSLDDDPKGKMVHAGEARPRTEIPSKRDDEKPMRRGASTGSNFDGTVDGDKMLSGIANEGTAKQNDSVKSSPGVGQKSSGSSGSSESASTPDNVDDSDKPSSGSIKDSLKQAAQSAIPRAAMDKESKGAEPTGTSSGSSNTIQPDNVDDSGKPSDAEIKDSIKQAERSNAPLSTMQEEVDEAKEQRV